MADITKTIKEQIEDIKRLDNVELRKYAISKCQSFDFLMQKYKELERTNKIMRDELKFEQENTETAILMSKCVLSTIKMFKHFNKDINEDVEITFKTLEFYIHLWLDLFEEDEVADDKK